LCAYIPVTVGGFEFVNNTTERGHPGVLDKLLYSYCGIPCDNTRTKLQYFRGYFSGINVSGEKNRHLIKANNECRYYPSDETRSYVQINTEKGTFYNNYYDNLYSSEVLLTMQIPCTEFGHIGQLNLTGENVITQCASGSGSSTQGATANLSIPIVPAYTIHGQVKGPNGNGLANQKVLIKLIFPISEASKCVDYVVNTNSSGDYRFFADPGYQYNVSLCSDPSYGYCLNPSSNNYNSSENLVFNVNTVTFSESALRSGQSRLVYQDGNYHYGSGSTLTFQMGDLIYSYFVPTATYRSLEGAKNNYKLYPASSSVTVNDMTIYRYLPPSHLYY
jgi:hypothetical protein